MCCTVDFFIGENADLLYQELTSDDDRADRGNL